MAKNECKVTRKGRPVMNLQGSVRSKMAVRTFDDLPKSHKHAQGVVHDGITRGHVAVFDTGSQKSIIVRYVWEIIKLHDTWIDAQDINMGDIFKDRAPLEIGRCKGCGEKPSGWEALLGNP